jgi:predicted amidohydrolase
MHTLKDTLRVAAFQREPKYDDVAGVIERTHEDLQWCDTQGVDLAVFPECYLQGLATELTRIEQRALSTDDPIVKQMLERFSSIRATVILGIVERRDTKFYNSAMIISAGRIVGVYSKTHPNEQGFEAGTEFPVFEVSGWKFGINICWDSNFPEASQRIADQGARLLCYPLFNMLRPPNADLHRERTVECFKARALQTGCWVVSADVVGRITGYHANEMSYGCTCIVGPDGEVVARATELREDIAMFDLS